MNPYQKKTAQKAARRLARMQALRQKGWTLDRIGRAFGGISRQRVSMLLRGVRVS
jgi:hypothetical protein